MRIDCNQRLGPKALARVNCINLIPNIRGADLGERTSEARVVLNERAIQIKDIHDDDPSGEVRAHNAPVGEGDP